jgi:peptidoglycan-associated lipoprotein
VTPDNLPEERVIAQSIAVPAAKPDPPFVEPRPADPRLLNALRRLSTVQFAFDSAGLSDAAQSVITANARILRDFPSHPVVLEGRADERGTVAYNLVLGERRAMRVRRYLQDIGIFDWRLSVISYGVDRPLCREHAEICWQVNRSVRFVIEDAPLF